jgi:hypothetical protein
MTKLRYTLGGFWGYVAKVSAYKDEVPTVPHGQMYQLSGKLNMDLQVFKNIPEIKTFMVGDADDPNYPGLGDNRIPIRKACRADADCNGSGNECGIRCNVDSGLCAAPAHGSVCTDGICCAGACQVGETLCDDPGIPDACP